MAFAEYVSAIHWGIWLSIYCVNDIHELISPKTEAVPDSLLTLGNSVIHMKAKSHLAQHKATKKPSKGLLQMNLQQCLGPVCVI